MNTEFPDPLMWGLNLEQWKTIAEAQRLNLEQLRVQNNELKSLLARAADALDVMTQFLLISDVPLEWEENKRRENRKLIDELRKAAE